MKMSFTCSSVDANTRKTTKVDGIAGGNAKADKHDQSLSQRVLLDLSRCMKKLVLHMEVNMDYYIL